MAHLAWILCGKRSKRDYNGYLWTLANVDIPASVQFIIFLLSIDLDIVYTEKYS